MSRRVVILGGGTGGTLAANRLRRSHDEKDLEIVVVDKDDRHVYQPGLLFVPFGLSSVEEICRPRHRQLRPGIEFRQVAVDRVDIEANRVHLDDAEELNYDVLVVASGSILLPEPLAGAGEAPAATGAGDEPAVEHGSSANGWGPTSATRMPMRIAS